MQKRSEADSIAQFVEHCKKYGLRITPQRCAVYKELLKSKKHPTADEMFQTVKQEFPNISYDTVNRTLLTFAEIGLVDVVSTKGGPRRFDPVMDNHHHFHCVNCGKIIDFYSEQYSNLQIPKNIKDDFTVFTKRVVLNGLCKQCRKRRDSRIAISQ
jgi:Fur family peroxide stress response transcriptional regulator